MTKTPLPDTQTEVTPPKTRKCGILRGIHWLITLSLVGVTGLQMHHTHQAKPQVSTQQDNAIAALNTQLTAVTQKLDALQNTINATPKQQSDVLIKAQYLLELAEMSQYWQHNKQSIIDLLNTASKTLEPATGDNIIAVRATIARDIDAINNQPALDVTGMLAQIAAMQNTINTLPFKPALITPKAQAPQAAPTTWTETVKANLNLLEKFVIIRHHDDAIKPLMTPLHQTVLRESIRLDLQQAQWAILENNDAIYQSSLTQAQLDIERLFDTSQDSAQQLLDTIKSLKAIPINATPKLNIEALPQLKAINEGAS